MPLRATAAVNLAAIERNVATLRRRLAAGAELCAVVKADGYGHGAAQAAAAALAGGATSLAVATADEAGELRAAGIEAPLLVMGAVSAQELEIALAVDAELVAWDPAFVDEIRRRDPTRGRCACTSSSTPAWVASAPATSVKRWPSPSRSRRRRRSSSWRAR